MSAEASWEQVSQQAQHFFASQWSQAMANFPGASSGAATGPEAAIRLDPAQLQRLQQAYVQRASQLWTHGWGGTPFQDRRFGDASWHTTPWAGMTAATYLLNAQMLVGMAEAVQADEKTRQRVRFAVEQWVAAMSPSNFLALNPEAQRKALETQGESLAQGIHNLLHDVQQGHVSMTDEGVFEVGKNVATSAGAVVYENDFFQLIEYQPLTPQVFERPLLLVPPCINKYYILDLQPDNSLIRYAVSQGHRTFVISWRNPDASCAQWTWDDYIEQAVLQAIRVCQEISGSARINTLGFCVGGTMLTTALAVLAARQDDVVASATLLTTLVDFCDTGILDVFIDERMVQLREAQFAQGGLLGGQELATTFSFLRPNELVWNYVVANYLKGEKPPAFDLLYWNSDATNLPGPWYAWYLRHLYLQNQLVQPHALQVAGESLNVRALQVPVYLYGSREDHIVPIQSAYASTQVFAGEKRFVMGASGHIAGVINPPSKNKRSHWLREDGQFPAALEAWQRGATEHPGSWWTDWAQWLARFGGKRIAAPKRYGKGRRYVALEAAPGRYVQHKI